MERGSCFRGVKRKVGQCWQGPTFPPPCGSLCPYLAACPIRTSPLGVLLAGEGGATAPMRRLISRWTQSPHLVPNTTFPTMCAPWGENGGELRLVEGGDVWDTSAPELHEVSHCR